MRPRSTIRSIVQDDPSRAVILLAWLGGMAMFGGGLVFSMEKYAQILFVAMVGFVGPLVGFWVVYVDGLTIGWTGRWLGGRASAAECRTAVAWSLVPQIATMLLWVPGFWLLGEELLLKVTPRLDAQPELLLLVRLAYGLGWLAFAWSYVLRWKGLAEVHGFSTWRAFFAGLLAWALVLAGIAGLFLSLYLSGVFPSAKDREKAVSGPNALGRQGVAPRSALLETRQEGGWLSLDGQPPVGLDRVTPGDPGADRRGDRCVSRPAAVCSPVTAGRPDSFGELRVQIGDQPDPHGQGQAVRRDPRHQSRSAT
jgi:hypothetical protein